MPSPEYTKAMKIYRQALTEIRHARVNDKKAKKTVAELQASADEIDWASFTKFWVFTYVQLFVAEPASTSVH